MEILRQRYPMLFVDTFILSPDSSFYMGVRTCSNNGLFSGINVPLSLLIEGMGQTAEYNIIINITGIENRPDMLYLAGVNKAEIFRKIPVDRKIFYNILSISKIGKFYISTVNISFFEKNIESGEILASASIIHGT